MIQLCPAYTLEALDECDIDRLLPFFFANIEPEEPKRYSKTQSAPAGEIVERNGKKYIKKAAKDCEWTKNIF